MKIGFEIENSIQIRNRGRSIKNKKILNDDEKM